MNEPAAVLRWLDDLDDLDGAGVVLGLDAGVPAEDVRALLADEVVVAGGRVRLQVHLGRNYMPGSRSHCVTAVATLVAVEPTVLPSGLVAERVVVVSEGGEIWTTPLVDEVRHTEESSVGLVARGPDPDGRRPWEPGYTPRLPWDTGRRADVLVRLRDATGAVHVLRVPSVVIQFSS